MGRQDKRCNSGDVRGRHRGPAHERVPRWIRGQDAYARRTDVHERVSGGEGGVDIAVVGGRDADHVIERTGVLHGAVAGVSCGRDHRDTGAIRCIEGRLHRGGGGRIEFPAQAHADDLRAMRDRIIDTAQDAAEPAASGRIEDLDRHHLDARGDAGDPEAVVRLRRDRAGHVCPVPVVVDGARGARDLVVGADERGPGEVLVGGRRSRVEDRHDDGRGAGRRLPCDRNSDER